MTSEARKQAWLARIKGPVAFDNLLPWGVIWKFERDDGKFNSYRLVMPRLTRVLECHIRPHHFKTGQTAIPSPHLTPLLRSALTDEDLAKAFAAILTYNPKGS